MPDFEVAAPPEAMLHAVCAACGHTLNTEADLTPDTAPAIRPLESATDRLAPDALLAGRYRIVDILGSGGAGQVYRAQDLTLNQTVALKLFPNLEQEQGRLENLHQEVRLARQISHANVCRVFDIGEASGHPFITMEFVSGEDLHKLLRRIGRLSPDKALQVSRQLCEGLTAAHEAGVLHRDLKPANVMLDARGNVRITDFGLAILAGDIQERNGGTPGYMAPEQLAGKEVTARSDIYALGLVLHELFTGKRALDPRHPSERVRESIRRPSLMIMPGVHPFIQQVIGRCLDPNPAKRPTSVQHVASVLSRVAHLGPAPPPIVKPTPAPETPILPRLAWSLVGASLAGTALMLLIAPWSTGIGLSFDSKAPDGSVVHIFTWLWCLSLQLFLTLAGVVFVMKLPPKAHAETERWEDAPATLQ
ncbi:MAG TPA: serine/threonine-protein kinase [Terriglobales bacterium]|nr:serine/threonine-protein kinase [Terriglobales bacterium]